MLKQIMRYPVKGLTGQTLDLAELVKSRGMVGDRQFALTFDESLDGTTWTHSHSYLINAFKDGLLTIMPDWRNFDASKTELPDLVAKALSYPKAPRLVERSYAEVEAGRWDYPDSQLSIMNLQTLGVVSEELGQTLDMDRFRGNLIIDDLPPWEEFGLAGWRYQLGEAEIEFSRPVRRCSATAVNPVSGVRDIPVNKLLVEKIWSRLLWHLRPCYENGRDQSR